jgi:hypothetical protein
VYLSQSHDEDLRQRAREAAQKLGLEFAYRYTGFGDLEHSLKMVVFSEHVKETTLAEDTLALMGSANAAYKENILEDAGG